MRFLDKNSKKALKSVCLYLTPLEAKQLAGYLEDLISDPHNHHIHFNDKTYDHELTVTVYRDENLHSFDERSLKLILQDE